MAKQEITPRKHLKTWASFSLGYKPFQLLSLWLWQDSVTGRCHCQQDTELVQHGLGVLV